MTQAVWKYVVPPSVSGPTKLEMPRGAIVLSVHEQKGDLCLWALVDPTAEVVERVFWVVGTGHILPVSADKRVKYIGTAHLADGALVLHVFELVA